MNQYTQANRFLSIETPLGTDTLLLTAFSGRENLSDIFEFTAEVLSSDHAIKPESLLGKEVTVTIRAARKKTFHGIVRSMKVGDVPAHNMRRYTLTIVPWLWFLVRTETRRIFQNKKTSEIVKQVFEDLGYKDFEFKGQGSEQAREYCVQYGESDLRFVSRLLAEDGYTFFFRHSDKKHTLVIDPSNAFERCTSKGLTYSRDSDQTDELSHWEHGYDYRKGAWILNDYNFKEPAKSQLVESQTQSKFQNTKNHRHYEYPGLYNFANGANAAKIRMEAEEVQINVIHGQGNCADFHAGGIFKLEKHETKEERGDYLLTEVSHAAQDGSYFSKDGGSSFYENRFDCIPANVPYRPQLIERPVMKGPQSAVVTGPAGEEIYIDEFGRIKVQFIWDRDGKKDENTSCFLRVMQSWAGNQWGASFIPRIGHEVIVTFLDGDPDRPIVTGTVYNGANKPVYSSKTQSGIKTRSTKGGSASNANELRFEDQKGSEQIFIHAEKNLDTEVENDETHTVDHDRTKTVKHDENSSIGNDRIKSVDHNQSETIGNDKSISVGNNHTESISKNCSIDVGQDHSESIGKNMTISVGKDLTETVSGAYNESVTKAYTLKAKTITLTADEQVTIKTGSASITMKSNGDITISGNNINIKGSGNVVIKGSKVLTN